MHLKPTLRAIPLLMDGLCIHALVSQYIYNYVCMKAFYQITVFYKWSSQFGSRVNFKYKFKILSLAVLLAV